MEIKLHYMPEKPDHSCKVLVFHRDETIGNIYYVSSVIYSAKYGLFNEHDEVLEDELKPEYSESVIAWAYMDEVERGVLDEADRHIHKG